MKSVNGKYSNQINVTTKKNLRYFADKAEFWLENFYNEIELHVLGPATTRCVELAEHLVK